MEIVEKVNAMEYKDMPEIQRIIKEGLAKHPLIIPSVFMLPTTIRLKRCLKFSKENSISTAFIKRQPLWATFFSKEDPRKIFGT